MNQNTNVVVKLNNVRLSFPTLFTPVMETDDNGNPKVGGKAKYSATFLLDKKANAKDIAALNAAVAKVKTSDIVKGKKIARNPVREGSEKEFDGYGDNVVFISARTHKRPGVVNRDLTPITEADDILFAGCYVNASVECYPYVHPKSGAGVTFSLRNVQFVKKGEPFGAAPAYPTEDFSALPEEVEEESAV